MGFLYALESIRVPFLDTLMGWITHLGGETVYMAVAVATFWCISKSCGYYMLFTGFAGTLANQFLKITCRIPRPWVKDPAFTIVENARAAATGYSFPSGHTQNIFSSFGCIARWTKTVWLRAVCIVIILLVAFSRMYLGVHTPLDVGVGAAMGLILVLALYPIFRGAEQHPQRLYLFFGVMISLTVAYLAYTELWSFPADVDAANLASAAKSGYTLLGSSVAMLICFHVDQKYTRFDPRASLSAQLVKCVAGLALLVLIKSGLKAPLLALFHGGAVADAVRYFLVVFFAAGVWPLTFRWFASWGTKKESK